MSRGDKSRIIQEHKAKVLFDAQHANIEAAIAAARKASARAGGATHTAAGLSALESRRGTQTTGELLVT